MFLQATLLCFHFLLRNTCFEVLHISCCSLYRGDIMMYWMNQKPNKSNVAVLNNLLCSCKQNLLFCNHNKYAVEQGIRSLTENRTLAAFPIETPVTNHHWKHCPYLLLLQNHHFYHLLFPCLNRARIKILRMIILSAFL